MGLLNGSITLERFRVQGDGPGVFGPEHLEVLERYVSGPTRGPAAEADAVRVGFLGGGHLFDGAFDLEKNVLNDALHCAVRIDANNVPSPVRQAWLQMELAALTADNPGRRPTKAQRQEAKEAVEQRCADEAQSGKYLKMQQFPVLWDARLNLLYFGGSSATASGHCADLFERAFELQLQRISAGKLAWNWAERNKQIAALDDIAPAVFHPQQATGSVAWIDDASGNYDYLGNEFLLWLWWYLETQSDTIALSDDSEVTVMLTKTLTLECPLGESGKETISAESPVRLPEAAQAIRSGKLPRKSGMTLVRHGQQYDLVLQAETFGISGAKVRTDDDAEGRAEVEDRVDMIRALCETVDLLFESFVQRRIAAPWAADLQQITQWLQADAATQKRSAA